MEWYEIGAALKYSYYVTKQQWEQARFISYITAQVQCSKKLKYDDIITFAWEKEDQDEEDTTKINKEDIERLNKLAEAYSRSLHKEKING